MRTRGSLLAGSLVVGLALGYSLSRIGFADYAQLHAMFTLRDPRLLLTFAGAVAVAVVGTTVFVRRRPAGARLHAGVVPGAVLFGTGWAVSGGCPGIPLVQLGAGYLPAVATIAGIASGVVLHRRVNSRWLHLDQGSCQQ